MVGNFILSYWVKRPIFKGGVCCNFSGRALSNLANLPGWWFSLQKMWGLNSWLKPPAVVVVALTCYKRKSFVSRFFCPTEISTTKKSQMGDLKQRSNLKTCSFKKEIRLINLPFKKEEGLLLDLQSPFEFWWICGFFYMYSKDQITKNFRYLEWRYWTL